MPATKSVYLAGPIGGLSYEEARQGWRPKFAKMLNSHIDYYSPMRGKDNLNGQTAIASSPESRHRSAPISSGPGILGRDFNDVKSCDMMVANFLEAKKVSIGTCTEFGFAFAMQKPVILICEPSIEVNPHWNIFLTEIATFKVETLEEAAFLTNHLLTPGC